MRRLGLRCGKDRLQLRPLLALATATLIAACGGGGDSGGGGVMQPSIPQNPPGLAAINYTGSTQAVAVSDANAGDLADDALAAMQLVWELGRDFDVDSAPSGVVNQTVAGAQGGTATIIGRVQSPTSGWIQITYNGFREQDTTLDGVEIQDSTAGGGSFGFRVRRSFNNVRIRGPGIDTLISCNLFLEQNTTGTQRERITGELAARDQLTGEQVRIENAALEVNARPDGQRAWDMSGRFFEGNRGSADLQSVAAVITDSVLPERFVAGGPIRIRGAGVATLYVSPLNRRSVALEIDGSGRGVAERSARLDWNSDFAAQIRPTGNGRPSAILGNDRAISGTANEVRLDGRFSSHGDGRFMSYRWRVIQGPPGGTANLIEADLPVVRAQFSGEGEYLVELVATEGGRSTRDVVIVAVPSTDPNAALPYPSNVGAFAPPNLRIAAGERVDIDLTPSIGQFPGTIDNSILVTDPNLQPVDVVLSGLRASFVPTSTGIFRVTVRFANRTRFDEGADTADVYVGRDAWFDRPVRLLANAGITTAVAASAPGQAGRRDLLLVSNPPSGLSDDFGRDLFLFRGSAGSRRVATPQLLVSNVGPKVLAEDVVGNALPDIVAGRRDGVLVFEQQAGGSYGAGVLIAGLSGCDPLVVRAMTSILAVDVNGDGRRDVIRTTTCGDRVEAYLRNTDGSLAPAIALVALSETQTLLAAADFNSDGRPDLLTLTDSEQYLLRLRLPGGGWAAPQVVSLGGSNGSSAIPQLCIGDVNSDGRTDIVAGANLRAVVVLQDANGTLSQPVFYPLSVNPGACSIVDITRDGRNDVAFANGYLAQSDDGTLGPWVAEPLGLGSGEAATTLFADLDGDGLIEAIFAAGTELRLRSGI
jgi:hypothetical protein